MNGEGYGVGAKVACSSREENVLAILAFSRHDVQEGEGDELESVVETWKGKIGMTIKIDALNSLKFAIDEPLAVMLVEVEKRPVRKARSARSKQK